MSILSRTLLSVFLLSFTQFALEGSLSSTLAAPRNLRVVNVVNRLAGGAPADVQNAINAAAPGSIVEIPNGTYTWTSGIRMDKAIQLRGASPGGVQIICHGMSQHTVTVIEPPSGNAEVYNLNFDFSKAAGAYVDALAAGPGTGHPNCGRILVHDCNFVTDYSYAILWNTNGGVIWNCFFDGSKSGGLSGISFVAGALNSDWTSLSTLGTDDTDGRRNTYIEDCRFIQINTGCTNWDDNSRLVMRHNVFEDAAMASHGQESSVSGARHWEIYDNEFHCDPENRANLNYFASIRGGTGIITDNYFSDIPFGKAEINLNVFSIRRGPEQIPCQTSYPAARQIGQGWKGAGGYDYPSVARDGTGYFLDPIYIWNNTGPGSQHPSFIYLNEYQPDQCGNNQHIVDYVKVGRDYKLEPRPGYQKYAYPHPMRTSGGGGAPTPTPAPSSTPSPTPPGVLPTPTPVAGPTYQQWFSALGRWIEENPATPDPTP